MSQPFLGVPRIQENLLRALRGDSFSDTVTFRGRVFETRYSSIRDRDGAVDGVLGVATDVTQRVRAEEEKLRLEAQLRQAQKLESLGVLAGGIAHDFNNLLMTILGCTDLAARAIAPTSDAEVHLKRIHDTARRAADLTALLLAYAGQLPPRLVPIDLSEFVRGMSELLTLTASKKVTLRWDLAERPTVVEGDTSQLSQVLLNLVTNASEALGLGKGSGTIVLRTGQMHCTRDDLLGSYLGEKLPEGSYVFLEVNDTGMGMDEGTQSKIFDPFFQHEVHRARARPRHGPRDRQGARRRHLRAQRAGTGEHLSRAAPGEPGRMAAPRSRPVRQGWTGSGTVLLVDDDPDVREVAEHMLRDLGFEVRTAAGGREALEMFRAGSDMIAAVVLDMTMPELSGDEVLAALRQIGPETPIVLMSGFSKRYAAERIRGDARCSFLQKPFGPEELAARLRSVLEPSGHTADSKGFLNRRLRPPARAQDQRPARLRSVAQGVWRDAPVKGQGGRRRRSGRVPGGPPPARLRTARFLPPGSAAGPTRTPAIVGGAPSRAPKGQASAGAHEVRRGVPGSKRLRLIVDVLPS